MIPSRPGEYGLSAVEAFGAAITALPSVSARGAAAGAGGRDVSVESMLLVVIVALLGGWVCERCRAAELASGPGDRTCGWHPTAIAGTGAGLVEIGSAWRNG
jgi:hypothetical protein